MEFARPKIIISRCLGFENCRYDAQEIKDEFVKDLRDFVDFVTVCPETDIGLKTPRRPLRIIEKNGVRILYQPATKKDFTQDVTDFSKKFLKNQENIDAFILKNRSPCCGVNSAKIYTGAERGSRHYNDDGFFTKEAAFVFPNLPIEDEGRLKNFSIRENFLTKVFTMAKFNSIKNKKELGIFCRNNEILFLIYSRGSGHNLSRFLDNMDFSDSKKYIHKKLLSIFSKEPNEKSREKAIELVLERFGKKFSKDEMDFFLKNIEEYRTEKIPFSVLIKLIYAEALRFGDRYLLNQTFLQPFPLELLKISDSGKGREY